MKRQDNPVFARPRKPPMRLAGASFLGVALLVTGPVFAQPGIGRSEWARDVRKVVELLEKQKWKGARSSAKKLAEEVTRRSWYGPALDQVLGELALAQAVAGANLGREHEALWFWHMACNIDFRIRARDLGGYGKAAKLFAEHPLRSAGEMPPPFEDRERSPLIRSTRPEAPDIDSPEILNNGGAVREKPGDLHVEIVIDKAGKIHHPVVKSDHLHPVVKYAVLTWLIDLKGFKPRYIEGEPTDTLFPLSIGFRYNRW